MPFLIKHLRHTIGLKTAFFDNDATSGAFDDEYCLSEEEDDNLGYLNDEDVRDQADQDDDSWSSWASKKWDKVGEYVAPVKEWVKDHWNGQDQIVGAMALGAMAVENALDLNPEEQARADQALAAQRAEDQANWDEADKKDREDKVKKAYDKLKEEEAKLKDGDTNANQDYRDGYVAGAYCIVNQRDLQHHARERVNEEEEEEERVTFNLEEDEVINDGMWLST